MITSNATFGLWLFSHFCLETKPPQNLNRVQSPAWQWRARVLWQAAPPPTLWGWDGRARVELSVASRSENRPGREPSLPSAHVLQLNPPALGRGDQPLTGASRMLAFRGGWDCFPYCQWENRDDFAQIFGKDSLWKINYNADCHFN